MTPPWGSGILWSSSWNPGEQFARCCCFITKGLVKDTKEQGEVGKGPARRSLGARASVPGEWRAPLLCSPTAKFSELHPVGTLMGAPLGEGAPLPQSAEWRLKVPSV